MRNPTMGDSRHVSDVDFDMLVTHVENTISDDKQRQQAGFTPKELMLKSNPALFSWENLASGDLTNPREMYTILSNKSKSIEDLAAKFKKELVKSVQTPSSFPKLSRTASMSDLEHKHSKGLNASETIQRQLNMLVLKRHNTTLADGYHSVKEVEAENVRAVNLPNIANQLSNKGDAQKVKEKYKTDKAELPVLKAQPNRTGDPKLEVSLDKHVSFSDKKLEKWFSEMPNEEFDKAQRALMEASIQERLQEFKRSRNRKTNFPHQSFNICIGSKVRKVPNTYLELRVDSFGRHLHGEKDDKRNRYRLQQKSMHNLKMREGVTLDPHDRVHREDTFPRLSIQNKSATPGKQKSKSEQELATTKHRKETTKLSRESGFRTVYINDKFGAEIGQNIGHRHGLSNYEEYTEKMMAMKEMQYQDLLRRAVISPPNSLDDNVEERMSELELERENTKAAVVTLELNRDSPHPRKPLHIEKSIKEVDKVKNEYAKQDESTEAQVVETEGTENMREPDLKHEKIITKIPTAPSVRTSESRSSNSSMLTNKEAMKKFNKLEVFAESHRTADINPQFRYSSENKFRPFGDSHGPSFPSSQKPDTKQNQQQEQQQQDHRQSQTQDPFLMKEIRRPEADVVFRFEPGEVIVSRKNPNRTITNTLSSERARVIYGKVAHGTIEKKNTHYTNKSVLKKEPTRDDFSTGTKSTKLENFYRSELSRFETRALDGSVSSVSPRHEYGTDPLLMITSNNFQEIHHRQHGGIQGQRINPVKKRDVATETDVIGSPKEIFYRVPESDNRSGSGLSDFIIDDNDGESLESDFEEENVSPNMRQKSNHSV